MSTNEEMTRDEIIEYAREAVSRRDGDILWVDLWDALLHISDHCKSDEK